MPDAAALRRVDECLRAAQVCHSAGLYADAVSRAYYAVFHAITGVLRDYGVEARSSTGLLMLVGRHLITPGLLERRWAADIERIYRLRIDADYHPQKMITEPDSASAIEQAIEFLAILNAMDPAGRC